MPPQDNPGNQPPQPNQPQAENTAGQPGATNTPPETPHTPLPTVPQPPQPQAWNQQPNQQGTLPPQPIAVTPAVAPSTPQPTVTQTPVPGVPGQTPAGTTPLSSPIAGEAAATPLPPAPSGDPGGNKLGKFKKFIPVIGGVVVALGIAAFLFLSPLSPFGKRVPQGPSLLVGDKIAYLYACSLVDTEAVAKTLELNGDKQKQNIEETYAFAPDNTTDKKLDLLKLTGEKSITSDCRLRFDRNYENDENGRRTASFKNVGISVEQYPSDQDASNAFKAAKEQAGSSAKALPSFGETSFYKQPTESSAGRYEQATVQHKNVVIEYLAPVKEGDNDGSKLAGQLDVLHKDVAKKIDSGAGKKAKDFSGANKIGKIKFVDACRSVNYRKVAQLLGGEAQFEQSNFGASHALAPEDNDGKSPKQLTSTCAIAFRTKADADAEKNKKPVADGGLFAGLDLPDTYASKFPHILMSRIIATENKESASQLIDNGKKELENGSNKQQFKVEDVQLGDKGILITQNNAPQSIEGAPSYDTQVYYIAKGSYAYFLSVTYARQTDPYKTTDQKFTKDDMSKVFSELTAATK